MSTCKVCGLDPAKARGRCNACATWWSRHQQERTYKAIARHLQKTVAPR